MNSKLEEKLVISILETTTEYIQTNSQTSIAKNIWVINPRI